MNRVTRDRPSAGNRILHANEIVDAGVRRNVDHVLVDLTTHKHHAHAVRPLIYFVGRFN